MARRGAPSIGEGAGLRKLVVNNFSRVAVSLALVAATTAALLILVPALNLNRVTISYLFPILIAATWFGRVAAVSSAVASTLALAFFFYPPRYALYVADPEHVVDLVVFTSVALLTSHLASELREHAATARQREREIKELYALSRMLAVCHSASDIYRAIQEHLSSITRRRIILFGIKGAQPGETQPSGQASVPECVQQAAVAMSNQASGAPGTQIADEATGNIWMLRPLSADMPDFGVVAIDLGRESADRAAALEPRIEAALADVVATLRRLDLDRAIGEARIRSEAEQLREALIGSVSHELRAPLASILGSATVLLQSPRIADDAQIGPLLRVVRDEAERLNGEIEQLLDAARVSSRNIRPRLQSTDPIDVINAAVERKRSRLAAHRVELALARDLPFLQIDPILIQQAIGQILDNAAKYSEPGSTIEIAAYAEAQHVAISVQDHGAGLTEQEREQLWRRFFRGPRHLSSVSGSGIGLWIAQAFVQANGGALEAASRGEGQGTKMTLRLPAQEVLHAVAE